MYEFFTFSKRNTLYRCFNGLIVCALSLSLTFSPAVVYAQSLNLLNLPVVGSMVTLSPAFQPTLIKGIKIFPDNPLRFDFIVDGGNSGFVDESLQEEATKLIKYFLASVTVPEEELWVNLSPYESDRIIPEAFGVTEMGRDLLAQDYILKQLTASLVYPEDELGSAFWDRIYKKVYDMYGVTEVPVNTFNKVWIVPDQAEVYENGDTAVIIESHLKVLLESDYLALQENQNKISDEWSVVNEREDSKNINTDHETLITQVNDISSEIVKQVILPAIEKEVNEGKNFASLRQIYHSMILATWFKQSVKESLLGKVYANQNKTQGVESDDSEAKDKIYDQYLKAFKKGVYNYIKEDINPATKQMIPRKYFSGGFKTFNLANGILKRSKNSAAFEKSKKSVGKSPILTSTILDFTTRSGEEIQNRWSKFVKQVKNSVKNTSPAVEGRRNALQLMAKVAGVAAVANFIPGVVDGAVFSGDSGIKSSIGEKKEIVGKQLSTKFDAHFFNEYGEVTVTQAVETIKEINPHKGIAFVERDGEVTLNFKPSAENIIIIYDDSGSLDEDALKDQNNAIKELINGLPKNTKYTFLALSHLHTKSELQKLADNPISGEEVIRNFQTQHKPLNVSPSWKILHNAATIAKLIFDQNGENTIIFDIGDFVSDLTTRDKADPEADIAKTQGEIIELLEGTKTTIKLFAVGEKADVDNNQVLQNFRNNPDAKDFVEVNQVDKMSDMLTALTESFNSIESLNIKGGGATRITMEVSNKGGNTIGKYALNEQSGKLENIGEEETITLEGKDIIWDTTKEGKLKIKSAFYFNENGEKVSVLKEASKPNMEISFKEVLKEKFLFDNKQKKSKSSYIFDFSRTIIYRLGKKGVLAYIDQLIELINRSPESSVIRAGFLIEGKDNEILSGKNDIITKLKDLRETAENRPRFPVGKTETLELLRNMLMLENKGLGNSDDIVIIGDTKVTSAKDWFQEDTEGPKEEDKHKYKPGLIPLLKKFSDTGGKVSLLIDLTVGENEEKKVKEWAEDEVMEVERYMDTKAPLSRHRNDPKLRRVLIHSILRSSIKNTVQLIKGINGEEFHNKIDEMLTLTDKTALEGKVNIGNMEKVEHFILTMKGKSTKKFIIPAPLGYKSESFQDDPLKGKNGYIKPISILPTVTDDSTSSKEKEKIAGTIKEGNEAEGEKNVEGATEKSVAAAKASSSPIKEVGGIDLNPTNLQIRRTGTGIQFELPEEFRNLENIPIDGFTPVIFQMAPITNLPLLLGINSETKPPHDSRQDELVKILE